MLTRRAFLRKGCSAAAIGLLARRGRAIVPPIPTAKKHPPDVSDPSRPFADVPLNPESVMIGGLPFAPWFTGDYFANVAIPFHTCENCFEGGQPPPATEEVEVAVVGGGLSGLASAYMLRRFEPLLFDLRPRFGGNAQGEIWTQAPYCIGSAYVIKPDPGSYLHRLYRRLGLHRAVRVSEGADPVELNGAILDDFWSGAGRPPEEQAAFHRYAEVVTDVAENHYPDLPLPAGQDNQWILDLDQVSFRQDLETRMGLPIPPILAGAVQAYFYSAFGASWEETSAASGWNFLAAEEYGRWVFPGGNAFMADAFWRELRRLDRPDGGSLRHLRAGCKVVDVRLVSGDRVQVTYADAEGQFRGVLARRVVLACSKYLCKRLIHELSALDLEKLDAIDRLDYRAYLVINILLDAPIERDFYDIFLLGDGNFPMTEDEAEAHSRPTDLLNGGYARQRPSPRGVLTFYWPLPFPAGRVHLIADQAWETYAEQAATLVQGALGLLNVPAAAVRQVRMTRWGHPLPIARVGLIADGTIERLRRPIENRIFFVNQDNWALPAVENSLLEARTFARAVAESL